MRNAAIMIACAALVAVVPLLPSAPVIRVRTQGASAIVSADGPPSDLTVVAAPFSTSLEEIAVYFDAAVTPARGMNEARALGLVTHLRADMARRGEKTPVRMIDGAALKALLQGRHTPTLVVAGSGIAPAERDALRTFVESGNVFVEAGLISRAEMSRQPARRHGPLASRLLSITGTTFDATTFGASASLLAAMRGAALGYRDAAGNSSLSWIPEGRGARIVFGDGFQDDVSAANDIAQLAWTGAWRDPRALRAVGPSSVTAQRAFDVGRYAHVAVFGPPPNYEPLESAERKSAP